MSTVEGWKNYETWQVQLYWRNDATNCHFWRQQARDIVLGFATYKDACKCLKTEMEESFQNDAPKGLKGPYADLLRASMDAVDFEEIADSFCEEFKPPATEIEKDRSS